MFLIIIAATVGILSYQLLTRSLPETDGQAALSSLSQPVDVYRDEWGVPHIFAENERDLFRAMGYVMAQDRLWQMDFNRRVASGRLSEIMGPATAEHDQFLRLWGFRRIAEQIVPTLSDESRAVLEAFCDGVNAYIDSHTTDYPIEFTLLQYKPEHWQIEDSIAFARLMAWKLSFSWYVDLVLYKLVDRLGVSKARQVFPDFPETAPLILPKETQPFWTGVQSFVEKGFAVQNLLGIRGGSLGSNSWVVSGSKTPCGKPILANDPHLELITPSVWYEMHLSGGDFNVAGVALPGAPAIVIGHNQDIAWGLTNGMIDDVDFYFERIHPDNANQYWNGRQWQDFQIVRDTIIVKNEAPVEVTVKATRNGTVVSELHPVLADTQATVSMRWVGQDVSDEFSAYLKLMRAKNWQNFTDALRNYTVPAQNFVFASRDGDIGYYLGGRVPIRRNATGVLPASGWLAAGQWVADVPFEHLPHLLNPESGYIATANNKIADDRYPYYLSNLWEPSGRISRIHEWLAARDTFTVDDFMKMQQDVQSVHAREMMIIIRQSLQVRMDSSSHDSLRTLFNLLKDWQDGEEAEKSVAVSLYHALFNGIARNTLEDEMGPDLYQHYIKTNNVPFRVVSALLRKDASSWFDNVLTERKETKADIIEQSLLDAARLLTDIAGDNVAEWRWGEIHSLTMPHPLGVRPPLDLILNLGPFPRGGSTMTINNAEYRFAKPFRAVVGPSTRQIVDMCAPDHSFSVITSGQSGQRLSPHYKDQTELWLNGEYREMRMNRDEIAQSSSAHLVLTPFAQAE